MWPRRHCGCGCGVSCTHTPLPSLPAAAWKQAQKWTGQPVPGHGQAGNNSASKALHHAELRIHPWKDFLNTNNQLWKPASYWTDPCSLSFSPHFQNYQNLWGGRNVKQSHGLMRWRTGSQLGAQLGEILEALGGGTQLGEEGQKDSLWVLVPDSFFGSLCAVR